MKSKFLKKIAHKILPFVVNLLQKIIFLTCKKVYIVPENELKSPLIWVCWHGQLLMIPYIYRKIKPMPHKIHVIVSQHVHGDIAVSAAKKFGADFIRGSSRRGAVKALREAIDILKQGEDIGITPDGPIGPAYSVSDGAIALSLKCDVKIAAIGWDVSSFWQLKSWDKAKIPKPFSTITFRASEPFELCNLTKEKSQELIFQKLMECMNGYKFNRDITPTPTENNVS